MVPPGGYIRRPLYCAALLVVITLFKQLPPLDTVTGTRFD